MSIGIYGIFRKTDDKCIYIGQSKNIEGRWKSHCSKRGKFNRNEYYVKVLEQHNIDDKEYRLNRESYFINQLNPEMNIVRDRKFNGYLAGKNNGFYGKTHTQEAISKIRNSSSGRKWTDTQREKYEEYVNTPEVRKLRSERMTGENHPLYGTHRPEDTCKKLSAAITGRHWYTNGISNKMPREEQIPELLEQGYYLGFTKKS